LYPLKWQIVNTKNTIAVKDDCSRYHLDCNDVGSLPLKLYNAESRWYFYQVHL